MPLHILLLLVIGGIAGIALALHLLGLSQTPAMTPDSARKGWLRHRPDDTILHIDLARDGHAARVTTQAGRGIVWHMGADTCARLLDGHNNVCIEQKALTLRLNDYTAPKIRLHLDPDEQDDWAKWISQT